eukprot:1123038-Amphidinium_carterae.1
MITSSDAVLDGFNTSTRTLMQPRACASQILNVSTAVPITRFFNVMFCNWSDTSTNCCIT